jgi:transposase
MVGGAVLTGEGRPVCCELWPGNQTDAQTLLPVVAKVRQRFGLSRVCWVADRGMISADTIRELEDQGLEYILGARLRQQREVRDLVRGCPGRYREVADNLRGQEVWVKGRRYVVCHHPKEAARDAGDREATSRPSKISCARAPRA